MQESERALALPFKGRVGWGWCCGCSSFRRKPESILALFFQQRLAPSLGSPFGPATPLARARSACSRGNDERRRKLDSGFRRNDEPKNNTGAAAPVFSSDRETVNQAAFCHCPSAARPFSFARSDTIFCASMKFLS